MENDIDSFPLFSNENFVKPNIERRLFAGAYQFTICNHT